MTNITTFPTIQNVLYSGDNVIEMIAGETITKGQVVGSEASTPDSLEVFAMDATGSEYADGVALESKTVGEKILVALDGCVCYVANNDDTTAIERGVFVGQGTSTVKGCIVTLTPSTTAVQYCVGKTIGDIAADGTGLMLIQPTVA